MGCNPKSAEGIPVKKHQRRKWGASNEGIRSYVTHDGKRQEQLEQRGDRVGSAFQKGHLAPHH